MVTEQPVTSREAPDGTDGMEHDSKRGKHDRSSPACLVCRQRKVKCDALECYPNKCTNCVQFDIKNCFLPAPKKRKSKKIEELLKTNSSLQHFPEPVVELDGTSPLAEVASGITFPSFVTPDMQEKYPELSEVRLDPAQILKYDAGSLENNAELTDWIRPFMGPALSSYLAKHFNGPTGYANINRTDYTHLVQSGCFSLPNLNVCWKWIDAFFTKRLCQLPILVERKFREEYKDLTNPPSLLLLHSILYCGAKYYDEPSWTTAEKLSHIEKTEILYNRALVFYEKKIELDLLCQLQSLLMMGTYKNSNVQCIRADPTFIRTSINLCYVLGIHNNPDSLNVPEVTKRLYKRIWWTLFITDTLTSFVLCKPWSMDESIFLDVPMITKEDLREDPDDPSDDETYETLYFVHRVKLSMCIRKISNIMNRLSRQSAKVDPAVRSNYIGECEQMMREWIEQLPASLLFKINSPLNNAFNASLSLEYYSALLLLYRMYFLNSLKSHHKEKDFPSWGIVFKAAHMVALIARYVLENNYISFCQMLLPFAMNIAGLMMIYHFYNKDKKVHNIAKQDIEILLEVLYEVSYKHPYARLTYFNLKTISEDKSMQAKMLNVMLHDNSKQPLRKSTFSDSPSNKEIGASSKAVGVEKGKVNGKAAGETDDSDREKPALATAGNTETSITNVRLPLKSGKNSREELKTSLTNVSVNSIMYNDNHNIKMPEMLIFNSSKGQRKSISPESRSNSMSSTSAFLNSHSQILPLPVMENQASPQSPSHLVTSSSGHGNQFVPSFIPPNIIPQRDPPFMHFRHTPIEVKPSPIMNMNVHSANQPPVSVVASDSSFSDTMSSVTSGVLQTSHDFASNSGDQNMTASPSRYTSEIPLPRPILSDNNASSEYNNILRHPATSNLRNSVINSHLTAPATFSASNKPGQHSDDDHYSSHDAESHNVLSQKFDLVMPPDMLPGINTSNWHPEFDTSLLSFSDDIHMNLDLGHDYMEFPL